MKPIKRTTKEEIEAFDRGFRLGYKHARKMFFKRLVFKTKKFFRLLGNGVVTIGQAVFCLMIGLAVFGAVVLAFCMMIEIFFKVKLVS